MVILSRDCHISMSQSQYGSVCIHDYLKTHVIALHEERDFQLRMYIHQKPFVSLERSP